MLNAIKEFFGFGGYVREPEGYMSWQHILAVAVYMIIMVTLAVIFGSRNRNKTEKDKNKVLIITAILIDSVEIIKLVVFCWRSGKISDLLSNLPLFLCSIQLIAIPLAAFTKGRLKEAALDFVFIFGLLGAVLGTIGAGQNYNAYPALGIENVASGITHSISGFATLYIGISGMRSMKKKNIIFTFSILLSFAAAAHVANSLLDKNYMFLVSHDGTPYSILYDLVGGHPVIYPIAVVLLLVFYALAFYGVYFLLHSKKAPAKQEIQHAHIN